MMIEHNPVAKIAAVGKSPSLRLHINAMCAYCMGCTADRMEPGFRRLIRHCSAEACPLWAVRPYQTKRA
jgi:hypothetical protein